VWRKARAFDPAQAAASTWIFAIARNLRIDVARREARPLPGETPLIDEPPSPGARLEAAQDERRLAVALAALPYEQLQVVRLAYFSDQPHTEIADDLSLPLGTVKSRMRLAMAKLRAMLDTVP
jgi:RNA polymerase sigma-70 factor (ECF subfamily)